MLTPANKLMNMGEWEDKRLQRNALMRAWAVRKLEGQQQQLPGGSTVKFEGQQQQLPGVSTGNFDEQLQQQQLPDGSRRNVVKSVLPMDRLSDANVYKRMKQVGAGVMSIAAASMGDGGGVVVWW